MPTSDLRLRSFAEILGWQSRIRIGTVAVLTAGILIASAVGLLEIGKGALIALLALAAAYAALAWRTSWSARRRSLRPWNVVATVIGDVLLAFGFTVAISTPAHYERVLIFSFFALHLTTFYFGRRLALAVFSLTVAIYLALVGWSIARGVPMAWRDELLSLAFYMLVAGVLMVEHGNLGSRLAEIVRLFERAEEGDFSEVYEDGRHTRPDAVTQVGRAYNRVRRQLSSLVLTDSLTGCMNRRGFDQALAREVARASRAGSEMSLLALDLDHFKSVNDTHGHLAGDTVLAEIGALLMRSAREGDVVARTGGEEFSIILPDTSATGAFQLASRICEIVRQERFPAGHDGVHLTVSIGVVSGAPLLHNPTREMAEAMKRRADEALYAAKRGGRDRVRASEWNADATAQAT